MGESRTGDTYLLVIKDDASKMVWLFPTPEATSFFVKSCLLQWFAVFGVCYDWISDQRAHIKNQVIAELQHVLGAHHGPLSVGKWDGGSSDEASVAAVSVLFQRVAHG